MFIPVIFLFIFLFLKKKTKIPQIVSFYFQGAQLFLFLMYKEDEILGPWIL